MKGVTEQPIWIGISVIVLILMVVLFYSIFAPSDCDADARLTAEEIKRAIECVVNNPDSIDPITGQDCSSASIRLCQLAEDTIAGSGFVQSYYGFMMPDYMLYYQKFPKKSVEESMKNAPFIIDWSESYPFEKVGVGQRVWDRVRLTFTEYKEYSRTKYLEEGCTEENAICFNTRGQEQIVMINAPEFPVSIERDNIMFDVDIDPDDITEDGKKFLGDILHSIIQGGVLRYELNAEENPNFHLISPCYGQITFRKEGKEIIGKLDKYNVQGANYCFADEDVLEAVSYAYITEIKCTEIDWSLTLVSAGSTKMGAKAMIKILLKGGAKKAGVAVTKKQTLLMMGVPCVDVDYCRGLGACIETMALWPGFPFTDLTSADMKKDEPTTYSANEVFAQCCIDYVYGETKDTDEIICDDPAYLSDLVKKQVDPERYRNDLTFELNMTALASHLDIGKDEVGVLCSLLKSDYSFSCIDADEARTKARCLTGPIMTYTLEKPVETSNLNLGLAMDEEDCPSRVAVQISMDGLEWRDVKIIEKEELSKTVKYHTITEYDGLAFKKIRFKEEPAAAKDYCNINYSSVVIGSFSEARRAAVDTTYDLTGYTFNYFITPYGYESTAKELCGDIEFCTSVSGGDFLAGLDVKYFADQGAENFEIRENERIGIFVSENSEVIFEVE